MTLSSPRVPADWTSDTKSSGAVSRQSASWYDQVAGCGGPKPTTTTCWRSDAHTQFSQLRNVYRSYCTLSCFWVFSAMWEMQIITLTPNEFECIECLSYIFRCFRGKINKVLLRDKRNIAWRINCLLAAVEGGSVAVASEGEHAAKFGREADRRILQRRLE